jgi:antitoxin ParD1/3/4
MLRLIQESIGAGEYDSVSDLLRDAVRVWQWQRQRLDDAARLELVRARVRRSLDDSRPALTEQELDLRLRPLFEGATASDDDATD